MRLFFTMLLLASNGLAVAEDNEISHSERQHIEKRIQSDVTVKIKAESAPEATAQNAENKGQVVFENHCGTCHAENAPIQGIGAPLVTDKAAWQERAKKGLKALVESVVNGLNAMPPKGTCASCKDRDFEKAIYYMLPEGVELKENGRHD